MAGDEYRFSLTAEKYMEKHHVLTYIEDAVTQLLEHKDSNPKVNVSKFFSDYFSSVKAGNHVLFREYAFVRATPHNRASFVRTFWKCFRNIGKKGDLLSIREYHSLLSLLCPDFPFPPVQKTARIILMEDAMDCLISFTDFLFAFQVQFCFEEFLSKCAEVYKELQTNPSVSVDTVVVPTSEENAVRVHHDTRVGGAGTTASGAQGSTEGVDAMTYYRLLAPLCEKLDTQAPQASVLRELLSATDRVTFYGFLMALAKSESLNRSIGRLPSRSDLWDTSDPELTSPPLRPGSALKPRPTSAILRSTSATNNTNSTTNATSNHHPALSTTASAGSVSATTKPPVPSTGPTSRSTPSIKHTTHTASRTAARRRRRQTSGSTESDSDSDDDTDSDSTN